MTRRRTSCSCAGLIGLVRQPAKAALAKSGLVGPHAHRSQQHQRQAPRRRAACGFRRPASSRPCRASACRELPGRNFRPPRSHSSACAPLWASRGIMPHLPVCSVRMRQLVGLSSTISRRKLANCGWRPSSERRLRLGRGLQRQREMERGPFLRHAFDPHLAAHQFDQRLLMARPRPVPPYWRVVEARPG